MAPNWKQSQCLLFYSVRAAGSKLLDWETYKQQSFRSHSPGGWEVHDQGAGRHGVCWEPASWFTDRHLCCVLTWQKQKGISLGSLLEGINHSGGLYLHDLITSKCHHMWIWGRQKYSAYGTPHEWWVDKWVYPHNGLLFSHKKRAQTATLMQIKTCMNLKIILNGKSQT